MFTKRKVKMSKQGYGMSKQGYGILCQDGKNNALVRVCACVSK